MSIWRLPFPRFGNGPALTRIQRIAEALEVDLKSFGAKGVVIVGSNGKGSTAAMTASLLMQAGGPVGLFTSPHLFALNERFRIDADDISDAELGHHWARVLTAIDASGERDNVGGFEFLFLIAADWFKARGCAHTVWEAGIGGRLDPVRLIQAQRVALTALDLEHTQLLGDTLEAIATDKIDAAPPGANLFIAPSCAPQRHTIDAHAAANGVTPHWVEARPSASLIGAHQQENAALAVALARDLAPLTETQIDAALSAVRWPGRLEVLDTEPLVVIDVGHTPAAVARALQGFETLRGEHRAILVCGVSADKDAPSILAALAPAFSTIICVAAAHKGAPAAAIAAAANAANPSAELILAENMADARRLALGRAGPEGAVYVAGGLFVAAEFRALQLGLDPAHLAFF